MNLLKISTAFILITLASPVFSQDTFRPELRTLNLDELPANNYKYYFSTPYLTLTNWIGENIYMYEFHFGYRITPKDRIAVKVAHWKIYQPMGIQMWNPVILAKKEWFSGRIREYGAGVSYRRMLREKVFGAVEVMPMRKVFLDENDNKIETGFRLYTSYHIGYQFRLFKNRFIIEPQIHCNYWPINSKGPEGFQEQVDKFDNYFLFEPNIYLGINL